MHDRERYRDYQTAPTAEPRTQLPLSHWRLATPKLHRRSFVQTNPEEPNQPTTNHQLHPNRRTRAILPPITRRGQRTPIIDAKPPPRQNRRQKCIPPKDRRDHPQEILHPVCTPRKPQSPKDPDRTVLGDISTRDGTTRELLPRA